MGVRKVYCARIAECVHNCAVVRGYRWGEDGGWVRGSFTYITV